MLVVTVASFSAVDPVVGLLAQYPEVRPVLADAGLVPVANDDETLEEACAKQGAAVDEVLWQCAIAAQAAPPPDDEDWTNATIDELVGHIVTVHHAYMRAELGRLVVLVDGLAQRAPEPAPRLGALQAAVTYFHQRWTSHLDREEQDLFPLCQRMESARTQGELIQLEDRLVGLRELSHDHDEIVLLEERLRGRIEAACDDLPERLADLRRVIETLVDGLRADTLAHARKEDDILLPAVFFAQEMLRADSERLRVPRAETRSG